jgi:CheY-like chemotaxis protein
LFRICFVDDDEKFEIPLFCDVFGEAFDIIAASDYAALKSQIDSRENWKPDLFVLDLYFPSGPANREAIEALRAEPLFVENDNAEIRSAYRNYLRAKTRLAGVLDAWKQNANGGLILAEKVVADYPDVPIVFYSRKATLEDVVRCMAARNVWSVERKPTGKDSADTIELTRLAQQRIIRRFKMAISKADSGELERKKEAAEVLVQMLQRFG